MSANNSDATLKHLKELRQHLLRLHKALLDSERVAYEQVHGSIQSNGEFLRLVIGHEWFSWLSPMSKFIVQIDEVLFSKESVSQEQINSLFKEAKEVVPAHNEDSTLPQRYQDAIQRDPNVGSIYAQVSQIIKKV
ncbi:MAG: hypothetical protein AAF208_06510 [Cyanobacteria bacterium P01_A01_bin.45]